MIYKKDLLGSKIEEARLSLSRFTFYGDSDHASRVYDSKCTSGGLGLYGENMFTYSTKAQTMGVATSTYAKLKLGLQNLWAIPLSGLLG